MHKLFVYLVLLAALVLGHSAAAQQVYVLKNGCGSGAPLPGSNALAVDTTGNLCTSASGGGGGTVGISQTGSANGVQVVAPLPAGTNTLGTVIPANNSGTLTQSTVTCGTASTALLAANTATTFLRVQVPPSAANSIWVNWAGVAAVAAPPSEEIAAGASVSWFGKNGFLPTGAVACIGSAAVAVTLEYK